MTRLATFNTKAPVPVGLMIVAGFATPFIPIALLVPTLVLFETSGEGLPFRAEFFLIFGALPGLILMPLVLIAAYLFNRRGWNGWGLALAFGALVGSLTGLLLDSGRLGSFTLVTTAIGSLYGAISWALSHGLATYAERKAMRQ